ncbi:purine-nucleoside phosphorylase [Francisella halioticida]|uniref:Purine-nucleoside phosphorylase n=1 Tax=Francisella halioticida TaxID=549298 RepID=A0ABM6M187_9GAMM|nr:purine-nucleoside phosphorylase [Francisella halioticida]
MFKVNKILVSSCLLGYNVRYDGGSNLVTDTVFKTWVDEDRLVFVCPEIAGGLSIPRSACEIIGGDGRAVLASRAKVLSKGGKDFSTEYIKGAEAALKLVKKYSIKIAILKKNSPSCGNQQIYDGTFNSNKIQGSGVAASLLMQNDVRVFNEGQLLQAKDFLEELEFKRIIF